MLQASNKRDTEYAEFDHMNSFWENNNVVKKSLGKISLYNIATIPNSCPNLGMPKTQFLLLWPEHVLCKCQSDKLLCRNNFSWHLNNDRHRSQINIKFPGTITFQLSDSGALLTNVVNLNGPQGYHIPMTSPLQIKCNVTLSHWNVFFFNWSIVVLVSSV